MIMDVTRVTCVNDVADRHGGRRRQPAVRRRPGSHEARAGQPSGKGRAAVRRRRGRRRGPARRPCGRRGWPAAGRPAS
ncbi:hypothetical protein E1212_21635 [Jiangella ureilytica]|uniref:Uncharacterized protein n=1 Tax=Jiangella ureilytica TaxID=2530374 RepID=A0A4R4RG53_9ACTN|nr:hypothetical protein E1212_21635 [Jiangella ureilytica]